MRRFAAQHEQQETFYRPATLIPPKGKQRPLPLNLNLLASGAAAAPRARASAAQPSELPDS